jgi:putative FmdB family regulatory protein
MPTYDFRCECGAEVTVVQRIDQTLTPPVCIGCAKEMNRQFMPILTQFKGEGFYTNDK